MKAGYFCEDCERSIWPASPRSELAWLKERIHVVREVAKHTSGGLDTWIVEGFDFLNEHQGHSVLLVTKR